MAISINDLTNFSSVKNEFIEIDNIASVVDLFNPYKINDYLAHSHKLAKKLGMNLNKLDNHYNIFNSIIHNDNDVLDKLLPNETYHSLTRGLFLVDHIKGLNDNAQSKQGDKKRLRQSRKYIINQLKKLNKPIKDNKTFSLFCPTDIPDFKPEDYQIDTLELKAILTNILEIRLDNLNRLLRITIIEINSFLNTSKSWQILIDGLNGHRVLRKHNAKYKAVNIKGNKRIKKRFCITYKKNGKNTLIIDKGNYPILDKPDYKTDKTLQKEYL